MRRPDHLETTDRCSPEEQQEQQTADPSALSKHSQRNLEALSKKSQNNIKNISKQSLKKAATTFDLTQPCSIKLLAGNARETRHMALNESKDLVGTGY